MLLFPAPFGFRLAIGPRNLPPSSSRLDRGYDKALSWRSKVEQVTEPAGGVLSRPAVQFGLHSPYRQLGRIRIRPDGGTGIHQCVFGHYFPSLDDTLPPFPMCAGFPRLGVLRRLRPIRAFGGHRAYPDTSPWKGLTKRSAHGWFPRSLLSGRRVRHPALPLWHRCGYAVDNSPQPPRPGIEDPSGSSPPQQYKASAHHKPARIHRVRAGTCSRGVTKPVPLVYLPVLLTTPGPSGSPEPTRLCRGCSRPPRRSPDWTSSSFTPPLRR